MKKSLFAIFAMLILLVGCGEDEKDDTSYWTGGKNNPISTQILILNSIQRVYTSTELYDQVYKSDKKTIQDSLPTADGNKWIEMNYSDYGNYVMLNANYAKNSNDKWINITSNSIKKERVFTNEHKEEVDKFEWHDKENDVYYTITVEVENKEYAYLLYGSFRVEDRYPTELQDKSFSEIMGETPREIKYTNSADTNGGGYYENTDFSEIFDKYGKLYFITE